MRASTRSMCPSMMAADAISTRALCGRCSRASSGIPSTNPRPVLRLLEQENPSTGPEPRLRPVERPEVAAHLELAVLDPDLRLVDLAVLGVQDGAARVAIAAHHKVPDDHEAEDGLVLVGPGALEANLRVAVLVVGL